MNTTIKRAIVNGLEWLCGVLDNTPWIVRTNESWLSLRPRRKSQIGCGTFRLATLSARLDERWGTDAWGKP